MRTRPSGKEHTTVHAIPSAGTASDQIAAIMAPIYAIGKIPLQRLEAERMRRACAAAIVRHFDLRRRSES